MDLLTGLARQLLLHGFSYFSVVPHIPGQLFYQPVRPTGSKITLHFSCLYIYIYLCAPALIMCAIITSCALLLCVFTWVNFGSLDGCFVQLLWVANREWLPGELLSTCRSEHLKARLVFRYEISSSEGSSLETTIPSRLPYQHSWWRWYYIVLSLV